MTGQVHGAAVPKRFALLALALSLAVALGYLALRDAPTASAIEGRTLAWRFALRGAITPPRDVVIAAIDDRTLETMQRWPLPRRSLATLIEKLTAAGVAAIGVDLLFIEPEQPSGNAPPSAGAGSGDQALADALRNSGRSVLALAFQSRVASGNVAPVEAAQEIAAAAAFRIVVDSPRIVLDHTLVAADMLVPIDALRGATAMAHVNMPGDEDDGVLRSMPAALLFAGRYIPALPVALAMRHRRLAPADVRLMVEGGLQLGPEDLALDSRLRLPINYYGPARTVTTVSVVDVIEDRVPPGVDLAGRTVLIGATARGAGDEFVTPFGRMPGVEVLATVTGNLLDRTLPERASLRDWDFAAVLLLGLAAFALARKVSPRAVVGVAFGLVVGWFAFAQLAFDRGFWLDVTFPSAAILLNAGCVAALRATIERRMRRNLARYHSPNIVDLLAERATPSFEGRAQNAAIVFVDIAGFTGRAEGMSPADTVPLLRAFHARVERAVLAHGGVLERFMGDGALVIFGVPEPSTHDAAAALACARALVEDVRCWNIDLAIEGQKPLDVSAGIHYGPVVMARLGGETQSEMTAAGDTVNVASRIEKLTREHDATIAISGAVVAALDEPERAALMTGFAEVPTQEIRGRIGKIAIWVKPRERASAA